MCYENPTPLFPSVMHLFSFGDVQVSVYPTTCNLMSVPSVFSYLVCGVYIAQIRGVKA